MGRRVSTALCPHPFMLVMGRASSSADSSQLCATVLWCLTRRLWACVQVGKSPYDAAAAQGRHAIRVLLEVGSHAMSL